MNGKKDTARNIITQIYPTKWQNYVSNIFLLFGILGILFLFLSIYVILSSGFRPEHIVMLMLPSMFILFTLRISTSLLYEPLIIFNNGIVPADRKIDIKSGGRSEFISFSLINKVEYSKEDFLGVTFIFKDKTRLIQRINNKNEFNLINEAFKKYKYIKN